MTDVERECELVRRLENLKNAVREYCEFVEKIKYENARKPRRKSVKGPSNNLFVYG